MSGSEPKFLFDKRKVRHRMRTLFSLSTDRGIDGVGTYLRAGRATNLGHLASVGLDEQFLCTTLRSGLRTISEDGTETFEIERSRADTVSASIPFLSKPQVIDTAWPRESLDCAGVGSCWDPRVIDPIDRQERAK